MLTFLLGFVACYLTTAVLALTWGWRSDGLPHGAQMIAIDLVCALLWPMAFVELDGEGA